MGNKNTVMDRSVFKDVGIQCDRNKDPIEGCTSVKRLLLALNYYGALDVFNNENDKNTLISFIDDVYRHTSILDDYAHFVNENHHLNAIDITKALKEKKLLALCHATNCSYTARHYAQNTKQPMDAKLRFYTETMDDLHLYVFHLFDYGLRTEKTNMTDDDKDEDDDIINRDKQLYKMIQKRKHLTAAFDRFKTNTKDNINIEQKESDDKAIQKHSPSFETGLIFYYWPYYKNVREYWPSDANTDISNMNDHNGHTIADLFVEPKYANMKEEITNYPQLTNDQYSKVMLKAKQYIDTIIAKKTQATSSRRGVFLHYDIGDGEAITLRHLLCVILYTDYADLRKDFASTFHEIAPNESLESIKSRNRKYWWMSKGLRETVEVYGMKRDDDDEGSLRGPFYYSTTEVTHFAGFDLRLCAPIATSKHIEIAAHFAGDHGMIVQFNNNVSYHESLCGFPCGWISKYKEEDEVIFIGGHYRIRIETVRVLNEKNAEYKNFEAEFRALSKFERMFNGGCCDKISKEETEIICCLVNSAIVGSDVEDTIVMDAYIMNTFELFRQRKQHIAFDYSALERYNDKRLRDIIFYEMKSGDLKPSKDDKTNVFRKELFILFPNIGTIDIDAANSYGDAIPFSFLSLLSEIENGTWNTIRVKASRGYDGEESWIHSVWCSSSKEMRQIYKEKGYTIVFKESDDEEEKGYTIVVQKM